MGWKPHLFGALLSNKTWSFNAQIVQECIFSSSSFLPTLPQQFVWCFPPGQVTITAVGYTPAVSALPRSFGAFTWLFWMWFKNLWRTSNKLDPPPQIPPQNYRKVCWSTRACSSWWAGGTQLNTRWCGGISALIWTRQMIMSLRHNSSNTLWVRWMSTDSIQIYLKILLLQIS